MSSWAWTFLEAYNGVFKDNKRELVVQSNGKEFLALDKIKRAVWRTSQFHLGKRVE